VGVWGQMTFVAVLSQLQSSYTCKSKRYLDRYDS